MKELTEKYITDHIKTSIELKQKILSEGALPKQIKQAAELCIEALRNGNKLMFAGNGGSAGDAQHLAAELVGRYRFNRPGLPAIALTTDTSMLTAIANDHSYADVFARQVQAQGKAGDVFIGISTSGNSENVLKAFVQAKAIRAKSIGFAGSGGAIQQSCDICLSVPSTNTAFIQESHIMIGQIICGFIEETLFQQYKPE